MPLTIELPHSRANGRAGNVNSPETQQIVVGLINNMPDAALEATEAQFCALLGTAAGPMSVRLRLSHLPEIVRANAAQDHIRRHYCSIDELLRAPVDALIVTGAEPLARSLHDERYWHRFTQVLEWADSHTLTSIWSCLAAHAAVDHLDAIARQRLTQKCCGVFEYTVLPGHSLVSGVSAPLRTPQSRWNDLPVDALRAAGYRIVSASAHAGANIFTKHQRSLLVFLQGHLEYEDTTLLKEYRRDVHRFLNGQQAQYPTLPSSYFSDDATKILNEFRERAVAAPNAQLFTSFPTAAVGASLKNSWGAAASGIYGNWLDYIATAKSTARSTHCVGML